MTIVADDLRPGQVHAIKNQGKCLTPQTVNIVIYWIGPDCVHYYKENDPKKLVENTTLERFLEILNQ